MRQAFVASVATVTLLAFWLLPSPVGAQTTTTTGTTPTSPEPTTTAPPVAGTQPAEEKVSFCHATSSVTAPYNLITTSVDQAINDHSGHTGPIFPTPGWGDIIPPFDYSGGHFAGLNWPAGSDILNAGCAVHETVASTTTVTKPALRK